MTKHYAVLVILSAALPLVWGAPQPLPGTAPTIDASLSYESGANPQISPDGSRVVYQVLHTDWATNSFLSDLWVVSTAAPHQPEVLTVGQGWNGDPQWSADGKQIGFVSDRSGRREIWVMGSHGGAAHRVTDTGHGVNTFRWSPDGLTIAFTTDGEDRTENSNLDRYGAFEVVKRNGTGAGLWAVRLVGRDGTPVSDAKVPDDEELISDTDFSVGGFEWSPDGKKIAFQADEAALKKPGAIYVLDLKTFDVKQVAPSSGQQRNPVWSPDGNWVAFEAAASSNFFYSNWQIARAAVNDGKAKAKVEILTANFDENADLVAWTPSGILFGALQRTASHLFQLDPETKKVERLTGPTDTDFSQFSVSKEGSRWAAVRGDNTSYSEVVAGTEQLTDFGAQVMTTVLASREVIRWRSGDGTEIEGVLMKPADFDPRKQYPLLVVLHGGPVSVDQPTMRPDRTYPLEQFVARGALVLRPNYRGSAGYGAKMRSLNVRNLGTGDAMDVLAGVDALIEKGFVDRDHVGAMGWSQGGFIAAYLGTATDRFRAVSVGAGISDWLTYYVNTDITAFTRQYMKATPWEDPEVYRKASPITYINQAKTPTLIQHGDQDRRVPIPNAYELRQALEDRGVPVKMVVYKGFGHSIDRPKQQRAVMEHNLEWFDEWVLSPKRPIAPAMTMNSSVAAEQTEGANTPNK